MAGYGYAYSSVSSYSTTRTGSRDAAVIKPFAPFVPKTNGGYYSEGAVTKKIVVPVTSRPYDQPAAEKYASSEDESDDEFHSQTIPVHSSPHKVVDQFPAKVQQNHDGGRNPQRLGPMVDRGRHSPQPTAEGRKPVGISPIKTDKYHGSGDRRAVAVEDPNLHKEGRKPIGGDSRLRSTHDGYDSNGYGSDKGHKPIENSIKNGNYGSPKRYGDDQRAAVVGDPNPYKEQRKPIGTGSIRSARDGYNNGYGGDKEGRRPIESNIKNGNYEYDSPNRYGGGHRGAPVVGDPSLYKEGHKPIGGGSVRTGHDGYNGDKEGYKPVGGGNIQNDYYDNIPNGYGGDYKEGHKPIGGGNIQNNYYDSPKGYGGEYNKNKPMGNGNYDSPNGYGGEYNKNKPMGNGNYDSPNGYGGEYNKNKPMGNGNYESPNGYGGEYNKNKPMGNGNYESPNGYGGEYNKNKPMGNGNYESPNGYGGEYNKNKPMGNGNYGNSYGNGPKISSDWSAAPRKGIQLSEPTHDIDKAMEVLRIEAAKRNHHNESNNDHHHYYDSPGPTAKDNWSAPASANGSPRVADRAGSTGIMRPHGNVNQLQSRPRSSPIHVTFVDDGRDYGDDDYYRRGDVGQYPYRDAVMDSREAEKKFKGTRV